MSPTLRPYDLVEAEACPLSRFRRGDIAVFRKDGECCAIVHRVVEVRPDRLLTRGDNGHDIDPWPIRAHEILGRAVAVHRAGRRITLVGGACGLLLTTAWRRTRSVSSVAVGSLRAVYLSRCLGDWAVRCTPPRLRPRPVAFRSGSGSTVFLMVGRLQVGRYDARQGRWVVRRPFGPLVGAMPAPEQSPTPVEDEST